MTRTFHLLSSARGKRISFNYENIPRTTLWHCPASISDRIRDVMLKDISRIFLSPRPPCLDFHRKFFFRSHLLVIMLEQNFFQLYFSVLFFAADNLQLRPSRSFNDERKTLSFLKDGNFAFYFIFSSFRETNATTLFHYANAACL